ncbi:putative F-box-like domain superfamily protein [Tanacetum coccineum]
MPDNVITNILDRLPVRDAVKTDVLSKNWKFKWTLLTHLIFDEDFFRYLPDKFVFMDDPRRTYQKFQFYQTYSSCKTQELNSGNFGMWGGLAYNYEVSSFSEFCSLDLGNTMKQLQLRSVSFSSYRGSENEVCLIKFILASSPLLKMIVVRVDQHFGGQQSLKR